MSKQKQFGRAHLVGSVDGRELLDHLLTDLLGSVALDRPLRDFLVMPQSELLAYAEVRASAAMHTAGAVQDYMIWCQVAAFLKKNVDADIGVSSHEREVAAMAAFQRGERFCKQSNKRLAYFRKRQSRHKQCQALEAAALIIQGVLPDVSTVYDEILDHANFGPGSTAGSTFAKRSLFYKVSGHQTMTRGCRSLFLDYVKRNPRWVSSSPDVLVEETTHDVLAYVPKNAKTHRTICKQPSINLFLQKGVEWVLCRTLQRVGVTLGQQERNGALAQRGSSRGQYATIDLMGASDSISIELCRWLLPPDWFELLMALRVPETKLPDGSVVTLAKISAMGNAYTFPLESLIFWAITMAVRQACSDDAEWRIYGDDIICHKRIALELSQALRFAGFRVNVTKSFFHGDFRESCGFDFLGGVITTPVYIWSTPRTVPEIYNLYNRLLCHRWFSFPSTLRYLQAKIKDPHRGPWSQPREDVGYWEIGFNPQLDAYFISEPPLQGVWNQDLQRFEFEVSVLRESYARFHVESPEVQMHLVLLGVAVDGCWISDINKPKIRQARTKFSYWPSLSEVLQGKERQRVHGRNSFAACLSVPGLSRTFRSDVFERLGKGLPET